ncbi:MAG: redoxin domain-containing protein [Phycisphaerae bacterium]|nr:redoxin domain-containing protein [Phycisphaerae bacterium]
MLRIAACFVLSLVAAAPDDIVPPAAPPAKQPPAVPGGATGGATGGAPSAPATKPAAEPINLPSVPDKWLEKLDPLDRAALEAVRGWRMPALPKDGTWLGVAPDAEALKGKVVLIQSFTTADSSKSMLGKAATAAKQAIAAGDVVLIGLHTPEGAQDAAKVLRKPAAPTLVDSTGVMCDALGVFRAPVNVLIDRDGTVRFAGLTASGLKSAIKEVCAESAGARQPQPRPAVAAGPAQADLPTPTDVVDPRFVQDRRGQQAPTFYVESWVTPTPDPTGRVLVIDFWATWCVPCVAAIPHMNDLVQHYGDQVTVVGVSSEPANACMSNMRAKNLRMNYAIACDPSGAMSSFYGVKGIPACVVVTSDGIVRWQGEPNGLNSALLDPIVKANAEWFAKVSATMKDGRWAKALKDAPDRPIKGAKSKD